MNSIVIHIPGHPVGKGRARAFQRSGGGIGHYTPAKTRTWEGIARSLAVEQMQGRPPLEEPVCLGVEIVLAVPQSWPAWKRDMALAGEIAPTVKPDRDNVLKAAKDALNGVAWLDDAYVTEGPTVKRYGAVPGVTLRIEPTGQQPAQITRRPQPAVRTAA